MSEYSEVGCCSKQKLVDDLKNVKGFGAKSVDKLRAELSVSGDSSAPAAAPAKPAMPGKKAGPAS